MNQPITLEVLGEPKPQPRPRAFARKMANGQAIARVYDAGTAEGWKSQVALAAREHVPMPPLQGPLRVDIVFRFPRPKAHFLRHGGLRPDAPYYHTGRPDRDNLDKAVLDALTTIGMWSDDGQICAGAVTKRYVSGRELPGARVTITPIVEENRVKTPSAERQPELMAV